MGNKVNEYNYLVVYNYIREGAKNIPTTEVIEDETNDIILPCPINPEEQLIKKQNYNRLSSEAKEVINIILNSPQEVIELFMTPKLKKISLIRLKRILAKSWNSPLLVENAIQEIKEWVRKL
jgi:hypothetical protein